ncbi:hypothetical protein, partial [Pelomonas sp. KK5]|uniref:hypothetical protein n=1 Tax=Pelomonas sp. KK5 TaxID=1855730 RepID=UPI001301C00A
RSLELKRQRERLDALHAQPERSEAERYERWRLWLQLAPDAALVEDIAAFRADHPDDAAPLFFEGAARLAADDATGLPLLERAIALDVELTVPACSHAHPFLARRNDAAAEAWARRWQQRAELEAARTAEMDRITGQEQLVAHGLDAEVIAALGRRMRAGMPAPVKRVYLARRIVRADSEARAWLVGVELSWWGRWRGKGGKATRELAAMEWPVPVMLAPLVAQFRPLRKKFRALPDAELARR